MRASKLALCARGIARSIARGIAVPAASRKAPTYTPSSADATSSTPATAQSCHTDEGGKPYAGGLADADAVRHHLFHQHHARSGDRHRQVVGRRFLQGDARRASAATASTSIPRFRTPGSPR